MNIINRYLWKNALGGIVMAWTALVLLDSFFALVNELEDTGGDNGYGTLQAVLYMVYTLPERFYEYFPTSVLVGTLLGLGRLASNSEFTAMRAAGISIQQIAVATLQLGLFLAFMSFVLGEWIVPATDRYAANFKAVQKNNNVAVTPDRGLWVKEKQEIIKIGKVLSSTQLADITIYRVSENYQYLRDLTTIATAQFEDNEWKLQQVITRSFEGGREDNKKDSVEVNAVGKSDQYSIKKDTVETAYASVLIKPDILKVTVADPEQLSSIQLTKLIKHQESNGLNADKFKLAFWKHFSIPFSALVMLMLAMPFLFSSQRSSGAGQRLFIGIVVGIVFFLTNNVLNEIGIVYHFPPLASAFFPVFLFLIIALIAIKRVH